jgi:sugar O-acyltransferase (sialic acid O-acetyltransferase NeuD family)
VQAYEAKRLVKEGPDMINIAVYGAGGFAREVAWLVESCNRVREQYRVVCFVDDNEVNHGKLFNNIPVMGLEETKSRFPDARIVPAIGSPKTRQAIVEKAKTSGFEFETIIHPNVEFSQWVEIGEGAVICAGNILTINIVLKAHIQINLDCTIGHDVVVGDFTTLAPGVHVSGWVHMGQRVYIGTGAVIINGTQEKPLIIGDDAVIGAGACVTKSVSEGITVIGVPARPLNKG